jgi:hypothetical protein
VAEGRVSDLLARTGEGNLARAFLALVEKDGHGKFVGSEENGGGK